MTRQEINKMMHKYGKVQKEQPSLVWEILQSFGYIALAICLVIASILIWR